MVSRNKIQVAAGKNKYTMISTAASPPPPFCLHHYVTHLIPWFPTLPHIYSFKYRFSAFSPLPLTENLFLLL